MLPQEWPRIVSASVVPVVLPAGRDRLTAGPSANAGGEA